PQHATYRIALGGRGDLVLAEPQAVERKFGTIQFSRPGSYLVRRESEEGPVAAELVANEPGGHLLLSSGRYVVIAREPDHLLVGAVDLRSGSTATVQKDNLRPMAYARVVRKGGGDRSLVTSAYLLGTVGSPFLNLGANLGGTVGVRVDLSMFSLD